MKKVLFVIPDKSYKSQDFVNSANKLGIDMVIITDSEQAAQQLGAKNIFSMEFDTLSKEKLNDLPQDIKLALPVDHSSVLFASKIVEELGIEGNSIESVENCLYKERTRLKLTNINQLQPRFIKAKSLNEINKFREKINSKIIIKPNDGVASIGVGGLNLLTLLAVEPDLVRGIIAAASNCLAILLTAALIAFGIVLGR